MLLPVFDVFIDGGGNDRKWVERYLARLPKYNKVFVFEPNPKFYNSYNGSEMEFVNKAMWTSDGSLSFYLSGDERQVSSSILPSVGAPLTVECVDFSRWLRETVKPYWRVTLKLDIEGAEYAVLERMIEDGTITLVNKLYVEFHADKRPDLLHDHERVTRRLKDLGVVAHPWD